jgi:hypothetical protein
VTFDWSNAGGLWDEPNKMTSSCEELLIEQARMVKAINPNTRVFVYRNMELGLQWLSSERRAMFNPNMSHYFLQVGGRGAPVPQPRPAHCPFSIAS